MWVNEMKLLERNYLTKIINVIGTPDIKGLRVLEDLENHVCYYNLWNI